MEYSAKSATKSCTWEKLDPLHILNLSLIRRETDDPVATHFYTDSHSIKDYSIIGIEKLYKDDTYRRFRENLWKKKLNTYAPSGINKKEHFCL
jgi:hypothetical protein